MANFSELNEAESLRIELEELTRSRRSSFQSHATSFRRSNASVEAGEPVTSIKDEVELQWAAVERLPTFRRLKTSLLDKEEEGKRVVDVTKLQALERRVLIDNLLKRIEDDNKRLLLKLNDRIHKVGLELPTVEVRYKDLCVEAEFDVVHGTPLPGLWTSLRKTFHDIRNVTKCNSEVENIQILKNVSGIVKPGRMTLLLGPPGCGKTTLLQALSGKLNQSLKVRGEISYNGCRFDEFVPRKTSAYISQYDRHISEMTVRETLDFSARCQGVGHRANIMKEVVRREKQAGIVPEPDIDTYMKAISIEGLKGSLQTDYILKILGLDICADTNVGDAMNRGISGGQKRRLTTGEMIVGPIKTLFMDEISNGLDTSTTYQIVTCLQQLAHIMKATILVSLLQPAPETFDLFDEVILMAEGKIVYHGPREHVLEFFEQCGFRCPPRKGIADFLQEVVSEKDQAQYWFREEDSYSYVSVDKLVHIFQNFHTAQKLHEELNKPFEKLEFHKNALSSSIYSLRKWELFKACLAREWLLMKRNAFLHVFKSLQLVGIAIITMTVFIRTRMSVSSTGTTLYMGSLFFALIRLMSNGIAELALTVQRIGVFYKQRDLHLYPAWAYSIPASILKIPFSLLDAFLWTALTYYVIGYSPEPGRFFYQFFILFLVHQVSISMFRLIASLVRNPSVAATFGLFSIMLACLFSGFLVNKPDLPAWLAWGFWLSPLAYAEIGISLNEFLAPRWQKNSSTQDTIGNRILQERGLYYSDYFRWMSLAALFGFWIIFNVGFTCALSYMKSPGMSSAAVPKDKPSQLNNFEGTGNTVQTRDLADADSIGRVTHTEKTKVVLPFRPLTISFTKVQYFVDAPKMLRKQGYTNKKLQLVRDITGAFRPGVLTAVMGVSGAGKTTLMDVLSGRKTGGLIEGDIRVGGYPKVQETYARVSAYCEQNDIHSALVTIEESVMYSAWLRLPAEVDKKTRQEFVAEVLEMIELDEIKESLVGIPNVSGISNEQRKRLTIAVELVSNPSIIFMDEPTTGLDARASAVVMRVVKNIVNTNRTVVCTIHQPSIHVFEAFDELILMKRGGQMIYTGELGEHSSKLIRYFEGIPGVPRIKENYNPATWMLEVTSSSMESQLSVDFAELYKESNLYLETEELVKRLSVPAENSEKLHFSTKFSQNGWQQFKACLWRRNLSYWRNPQYNLGRLVFIIVSSLILAAILWQKGQKIKTDKEFFNVMGPVFIFILLTGISNCSSVLPFISTEKTIMYRERFARMYSSWAYCASQVVVEIPYIFTQALLFSLITYPAAGFYQSGYKAFWYFYSLFCSLLFFNYYGLLLVSLTPTYQMTTIFASLFYTLLSLFSGYLIPQPKYPKWWVWCYWLCPISWSLKGLLTSQYGDVKEEINVFGEMKPMNEFLQGYLGYNHGDLDLVALILLAYPIVSALVFAFAIAKLNFQKV